MEKEKKRFNILRQPKSVPVHALDSKCVNRKPLVQNVKSSFLLDNTIQTDHCDCFYPKLNTGHDHLQITVTAFTSVCHPVSDII